MKKEGVDLIFIIGSSLAVSPFNYIPLDHENTPRVLINLENTKECIDFTKGPNKLFLQGKCDPIV